MEGMTRRAVTVVGISTYKPLGEASTTPPEPQSLIYTVNDYSVPLSRPAMTNNAGDMGFGRTIGF